MRTRNKLAAALLIGMLTLTACTNGMVNDGTNHIGNNNGGDELNGNGANNGMNGGNGEMTNQAHGMTGMHGEAFIPGASGVHSKTTNERGATTYGMGTSTYSRIGSSGLQSEGFSSHLESRLSGAGIDGVSVLVIDDLVVAATEREEMTASQYDPMQRKVLSQTGGFSGHGQEPGSRVGTYGTEPEPGMEQDNNLEQAVDKIHEFMGANVKILTATSPEAVELIQRIRSEAHGERPGRGMADDIVKLLELASDSNSK
ncbi:hypothetical protein IDH44_01935 [Paenibacillus sp. IB182496]|uniref:Sporulation lipoprotein YhcN/YlaJ n=1 Tax=Paenibacillus sabuli TaxID=2772509 RepID=A0A927BQZ9_9BACL|nr:hypothetical protein [Paenibacillus sabuli]MBD2843939.1 hypothetical protein [Paenibacillus sabuli]